MRSITTVVLLFVGFIFFGSRPSSADWTLHHWENHYEPLHSITLEGDALYYMTNQNYNAVANTASAPNSDSYKRFELDGLGQFGVIDRFSLFGRLAWGRIESDNSIVNASNSGLVDQTVGGTFRAYESAPIRGHFIPSSLDLQAQADFPGYSNGGNDASKTPYLGDQTVDVTVGGFLTIPAWQENERAYLISGGAGYTFRSSHFAAQIPFTLIASTEPKATGPLGSISLFGIRSANNDTTQPASRPSGFATGAGGSLITDAINPQTLILRGEVGYQLNLSTRVFLSYEQSVWGENAPNGQMIWGGFRVSYGPSTEETSAFNKANQGLTEYSLDARVMKANDRLNLVKIDKGSQDGVAKGQVFDIFSTRSDGSPIEAIARAEVTSVKSDEAALTIVEYFKQQWINEGFVAKRLIQ